MKLNWGERLAVNNPLRPIQQQLEMNWFRRKYPLPAGANILEVGCGRGAGAAVIHRTFHPSTFHVQDLDVDMIRMAKNRYAPAEDEGLTSSVGDAAHLSFKSECFDAVFGFGILHHVPNWRSALREIVRVLKPGGVYYAEELYPSLYQNIITKHILLHPTYDRFQSNDLKTAFTRARIPIKEIFELKKMGILAVAVKLS